MKTLRYLIKFVHFWNYKFSIFILCIIVTSALSVSKTDAQRLKTKRSTIVKDISDSLPESSGLINFQGLLWTHNDSGGEAALFGLNIVSGEIVRTIRITNVENKDWETLASDSSYIYIGDIGNNAGTRTDLVVYRIGKNAIQPNCIDCDVNADSIRFSYANQDNFEKRLLQHPFDGEALIVYRDSLYIFSKNWESKISSVYALPKVVGSYSLKPSFSLNEKGLITGADYFPADSTLILIGYRNAIPFILYYKVQGDGLINMEFIKRKNFFFLIGRQTESILKWDENTLLFSTEKKILRPKIYQLLLKQ